MFKRCKRKPVVKVCIYIEPLDSPEDNDTRLSEIYAQEILNGIPTYLKKKDSKIKYHAEVIYVKEDF